MVNIKSIYFPNSCLQGTEIPASFLWDKNKNLKILLEIPENVKLSSIYNVPEDGIEIEGNKVIFNKFEINGYLGLVFETMKNISYSLSLNFKCTIFSEEEETKVYEKQVNFFRPSIEPIDIPQEIIIKIDKNKISVNKIILIKNKGEGTGIVELKLEEDSDFKKERSIATQDFVTGFRKDLISGFNSLQKEYSDYNDILARLIEFIFIDHDLSEESIMEFKKIKMELTDVLLNDQKFAESFFHNYFKSFVKNMFMITPYDAFISYLNSIENGNVIIRDPVDVLTISKNTGILKGKLEITDMNMNIYTPIDLGNIKIQFENVSKFPIQIPVCSIFKWE